MSLLWRLVFTSRCTSTHHKLALDSLRFLRGPMADLWSNLFLANHEQYLTGSKAPDDTFKDFKNHVLHVEQGFWGGATLTARAWYQKTVTALNQGNWPEAVYNAGVLSHYFTDPFQPFHTDQCEAEGKVHRAAEWSITKSYDELQAILEHDLGGYPQYELPERPDWLEEAIRAGATEAHQSYHLCIDHYDLGRGIKNPPSGLDQEMKDRLAHLIGLASVGFSRVLERAFEEAAVTPPDVAVSLHAFLATLKVPLNWIMKKITDAHERAIVEAIYLEVQEKGKAIDSLPEDEKVVRKLHAQEVLRIPMRQLDAEPARPTGSQYGTGKPARGLTARTSGTAAFERTSISAPLRLNSSSAAGAEPGLESCLMVPLAANNPIDHVADTALRALLSQATTRKAENASSPEAQLTAKWLNRGSLPPSPSESADRFNTPPSSQDSSTDFDSAFLPPATASATKSVDNPRPQAPASLPTRGSDQAPNPKRLASTATAAHAPGPRLKKPRIPADSYPEISPPSPTLATATATLDYTPPASGLDEAMFAPLPPMPRVKQPRPEETKRPGNETTAAPTPATAQQQKSAVTDAKPPKQVTPPNNPTQRSASQPGIPGTPRPPAGRTSAPAATRPVETRKTETRASESRFATEKSYSAEPPASPIPVPHIRTDDRPSDDLGSEDRQTSAAAVQPAPRIVVSTSQSASQTGHQPINRLANVNPARPQQLSQARSDTVAARPQNVNFDFQTTAGPTQTGRSDSIQSSLFAALTTPQISRTEPATAKPTPAAPQAVTSATPAAPRPNMFQRPISSPPAPVSSPQNQPVQLQPIQKQPTQTPSTRPQPAVPQPTAPQPTALQPTVPQPTVSEPNVSQPTPVAAEPSVQVQPNAVVLPQADSHRQPAALPENRVPVPVPGTVEQSQPATDAATVQSLPEVEKPAVPQPEAAAPESSTTAKLPESARPENTTPRPARDRRFYLELQSPLKDAPSIGPKTAELFEAAGVRTVFDLFRINTDRAAEKLGRPHITAAVLKDWQAQALLVCRVPELRGHDAQYLVACGVRTAEQLANCDPQVLLTHVQTFIATSVGQRLLRGGKIPDLEEVTGWITSGRSARSLRNE